MAQGIPFLKMHALGNDFVILDARGGEIENVSELAKILADRHRGVGCDQVVVLERSGKAAVFMRIFNSDGSEAGACGNATRCVADLVMSEAQSVQTTIETVSGILSAQREEDKQITVDMGSPRLRWDEIPLASEVDTLSLPIGWQGVSEPVAVNMGNPHAVFFVGDADAVPIEQLGPRFERDIIFPKRANIEFAEVINRQVLKFRVWERGSGVTPACGSGACAVAVAAIRRNLTTRKVTVKMDGGDLLIEWKEADGHVYMTGPFSYVFRGEFFL